MLIAQDTAVRPNQSGFGTASDGETYTLTGTGTASIVSNELVLSSVGSDTLAQLGTRTITDGEVLCRLTIGDPNDILGIQARFSVSGGQPTCYKLLWYGGNLHLNKAVAGVNSQLTTVAFTMSAGVFVWFRLRVQGSGLYGRAWQDGTAEPGAWMTTITDTDVASAGGFALLGNTAVASSVQFDHFSALTLVSTLKPRHRTFAYIPL